MSLSRQGILGAVLFIGGSIMLYAMVQKVSTNNAENTVITSTIEPSSEQSQTIKNDSQSDLVVEPLTTDIETEERILAKKQQQRIANVKEQEKRTQAFLEENQKAADAALAKARAENEMYAANIRINANNNAIEPTNTSTSTGKEDDISRPVVTKRQAPEPIETVANANSELKEISTSQTTNTIQNSTQNTQANNDSLDNDTPPKSPINYTVKRGDGLIKLARQYNVSLEALAATNNISTNTDLTLGQRLTIPSAKQIARLEREAEKEKEEKRQQELLAQKSAEAKREAQKKLKEARQTVKETDAKGNFGVQVALASNQQRADEVVAKFRKAGYQVSTSPTSRGVRVMVGPERGKVAAIALKDKINSDPNVSTTGAWVLYWR